ncbi:hypothetical protein D3C72_2318360 [compost metagenome]
MLAAALPRRNGLREHLFQIDRFHKALGERGIVQRAHPAWVPQPGWMAQPLQRPLKLEVQAHVAIADRQAVGQQADGLV